MSNRQSYCSRKLPQIATVALAIVLGGCGSDNERILKYDAVRFVETDKGTDSFYCVIEDWEDARIRVTRPDGESREVREIDVEWVAAEATEEEVSEFVSLDGVRHTAAVRRTADGRTWIAAYFENGVPSAIFLYDGAAIQGDDSDNLKLPASERQIREAFGRPKKVYRRKQRSAV